MCKCVDSEVKCSKLTWKDSQELKVDLCNLAYTKKKNFFGRYFFFEQSIIKGLLHLAVWAFAADFGKEIIVLHYQL